VILTWSTNAHCVLCVDPYPVKCYIYQPEGRTDDLNHRRNTSTVRNHAKMTDEVRGIKKIALWSFNTNNATNLDVSDVARDIAFFICLEGC
jgi:hypothetical protein